MYISVFCVCSVFGCVCVCMLWAILPELNMIWLDLNWFDTRFTKQLNNIDSKTLLISQILSVFFKTVDATWSNRFQHKLSSTPYLNQVYTVTSGTLVVSRHRLSTYGRRAFAVAGPMTFNALPDELRDPTVNTTTFKDIFFLELSTRLVHKRWRRNAL